LKFLPLKVEQQYFNIFNLQTRKYLAIYARIGFSPRKTKKQPQAISPTDQFLKEALYI